MKPIRSQVILLPSAQQHGRPSPRVCFPDPPHSYSSCVGPPVHSHMCIEPWPHLVLKEALRCRIKLLSCPPEHAGRTHRWWEPWSGLVDICYLLRLRVAQKRWRRHTENLGCSLAWGEGEPIHSGALHAWLHPLWLRVPASL